VLATLLVYPLSLAAYYSIEKPCRGLVRVLLEGKQNAASAPMGPLGIPAL
jgi:peptidoglycan/LPS O-acetylase OafA/YrhL